MDIFLFYITLSMYFVYILQGKTKHYIGYTNNLKRRLAEHKRWWTETTKHMKDFVLLWYFEKNTQKEAQKLEKMIKKNWHIHHWIEHITFKKI
jgi:predicted GIY-YIG superfamily endonuclease